MRARTAAAEEVRVRCRQSDGLEERRPRGAVTSGSGEFGERQARQGTSGDLDVLQEKMVELGGERGDVAGGGGERKKRGKWGWEE
jgi:hypothetical protein